MSVILHCFWTVQYCTVPYYSQYIKIQSETSAKWDPSSLIFESKNEISKVNFFFWATVVEQVGSSFSQRIMPVVMVFTRKCETLLFLHVFFCDFRYLGKPYCNQPVSSRTDFSWFSAKCRDFRQLFSRFFLKIISTENQYFWMFFLKCFRMIIAVQLVFFRMIWEG